MRELAKAVDAFITRVGITEDWTPGESLIDDDLMADVVNAAITMIYQARRR